MKYFGINLGHDASIVGIEESGDIFFYAQAERYGYREKGYGGDLKPIIKEFKNLKINKNDIIFICPCFLRDIPKENKSYPIKDYDDCIIRRCEKKYANSKLEIETLAPKFLIDHHLSHAISSWCFRENNKEKLFICYDGCGPWADEMRPYKSSLVGSIREDGFSIFYNHEKIPSSMPINHLLGARSAGKLMGLAGYLPESKEPLNQNDFIKWLDLTCESNFVFHRVFPTKKETNKNDLVFFSKIYTHYMNFIWEKIKINIDKFSKDKEILIGGGTALALDINTKIFNYCKNLTFGPPADDSGLALGAAAFAYFYVNKKWPKLISNSSLNCLNKEINQKGPQEPKEIANLIHKGKILGLIREKSEAGPRALGFRSIFASAVDECNLQIVSQQIKEREFYRPLAPIVTEESFDDYFIGPKGKYMQFKCSCNENSIKSLPAIVHKDLSARPQVVYKENDPWLYELLKEYGKLSGHECFINTSLNKKNKPICNNVEDAIYDFNNKNIDIISIKSKNFKFFI